MLTRSTGTQRFKFFVVTSPTNLCELKKQIFFLLLIYVFCLPSTAHQDDNEIGTHTPLVCWMHLILPQSTHTHTHHVLVTSPYLLVSTNTTKMWMPWQGKDGEGFWNLIAFKDMETRFVLSDYSPSLATISSMRSPLQPHIKTPSLFLLLNELWALWILSLSC